MKFEINTERGGFEVWNYLGGVTRKEGFYSYYVLTWLTRENPFLLHIPACTWAHRTRHRRGCSINIGGLSSLCIKKIQYFYIYRENKRKWDWNEGGLYLGSLKYFGNTKEKQIQHTYYKSLMSLFTIYPIVVDQPYILFAPQKYSTRLFLKTAGFIF